MIDFHSHILPNMDDGSSDVDESLALLNLLHQQKVRFVCATPHFDPAHDSPSSFLERRHRCFENLSAALTMSKISVPRILVGAEVMFFSGISAMSQLSELCLQGTKLLLLEMPVAPWTEYMVREVLTLSSKGNLTIVLAHFERYLEWQKKNVWGHLIDHGILLQSNASFFINPKTRRKALKLFGSGQIHFLGSDCHNLTYRPPRIGEAVSFIEGKYGPQAMNSLKEIGKGYVIK